MKPQKHQQLITNAKPLSMASVMVAVCFAFVLIIAATPSLADGGASTRAEAISQALADSGDAKVLGVKESTNEDGDAVFIVKIISDGRVKVIQIPKTASE